MNKQSLVLTQLLKHLICRYICWKAELSENVFGVAEVTALRENNQFPISLIK